MKKIVWLIVLAGIGFGAWRGANYLSEQWARNEVISEYLLVATRRDAAVHTLVQPENVDMMMDVFVETESEKVKKGAINFFYRDKGENFISYFEDQYWRMAPKKRLTFVQRGLLITSGLTKPLNNIVSKTDDPAMKKAIVQLVRERSGDSVAPQASLLPTGDQQLDAEIISEVAKHYAVDADELAAEAGKDGSVSGEKVLQAAKHLDATWPVRGQYKITIQRNRDMALVPVVLTLLVRGPAGPVLLAKDRGAVSLAGGPNNAWRVNGETDGCQVRFPVRAFGLSKLAAQLNKQGKANLQVPGFDEIDAEAIRRNKAEAKALIDGELVFSVTAPGKLEATLWGAKITLTRAGKPG